METYRASVAALSRMALAIPVVLASAVVEAQGPTESRPGEAYYHFCLGRMYEMQMQSEKAISSYQEASRLDPGAAYPHVALAELYQRTRQVEKALASAEKAAELGPELAAAQRALGKAYFTMLRNGGSPELAPLAIRAYRETVRLDPGDLESRSELARLLIANREPAAAAVELEEVLRREPNAYYDMYLLAQVRQGEGKIEEALQLLKQSLAIEPRQPEARERLRGILQAEGRYEELVELYGDDVSGDPTDVEARVRYADALANTGRLSEAAVEFQAALDGDPENVIAGVGLAMVNRELKKYDEAEKLLSKVLELQPGHVLARFTLAGIYEERREFPKAIEEWKKLLELPSTGEDANARKAEYWAHLGFSYGELERHEESVAAFAEARKLAGEDERFEAFYIQALLEADQPSEARQAIETALKTHPDSLRLKVLETRVLDDTGEPDEALERALALSSETPDDEMAIQGVIDLYSRRKDFASAEAFLREKLEKTPENAALLFQLGAVLERQDKVQEAAEAFEKVLEIEPDSAVTLNYLGYMLADNGVKLEQSLEYVQRALAQDPHNGAYLDSLGWVYFKMGKLDLAEDNLLKALESLRLTGVVYDHLGDLYFRKGNLERALSFWKKALDEEDDELEKDEVVRKIEEATVPR